MIENRKYPRTPHFEEFNLRLREIAAHYGATRIVIEEKLDGANSGMQFDSDANILTRSRGNFLMGGYREKQFDVFRRWADWISDELFDRISDEKIVYGEWMRARHSIFYDRLPHLFHEFDIYDIATDSFLSTPARAEILKGLPIVPVPVLYEGPVTSDIDLRDFIRPSVYRSQNWEAALRLSASYAGVDVERAVAEGDCSPFAEGVYVKFETDEHTVGRMKLVRPDFTQVIIDSGSHWADRPLIENRMTAEANMFLTLEELEIEHMRLAAASEPGYGGLE